jgi:hypothetical protein
LRRIKARRQSAGYPERVPTVLEKLATPVAVCSVCHALTNAHENLNHRCHKIVHGRRCYGTFKSGLSYLWDECDSCHASGRVGSQACAECGGFGWRLYA